MTAPPNQSAPSQDPSDRAARPHIPHPVRRQVVQRDGLQCSFIAPDGRRCQARAFLELDHERAWAQGGPHTADNLRLLCARHNALHAEQCFGAAKIHGAIAQRRKQTA